MSRPANRRQFLQSSALTGLGATFALPAVSATEAKIDPKVVQIDSGIEPLVRLLEETPRDRLVEEVGRRVRNGLAYRDVLAALLLAGVRNVEPRPAVGFKFHAVLVVNSAHLASLAAPDSDRWLPILWAVDNFKSAQAQNQAERGGWRMPPVREALVPPARKARAAFESAMNAWDPEAVDVATASLVRNAGADEVMELFWRFAPRDFRSIGHKAIFAANVRRTLAVIGWHHAEPVLRSLAYACLQSGNVNPAKADEAADRPGRANWERVKSIRAGWLEGKADEGAASQLLATFRSASADEAAVAVVDQLNRGVAPATVWSAVLAGSAELLMRSPGIVSLHSLTTANAIRFAYETSGNDETRRWLLLQNAAYSTLFRDEIRNRKSAEADVRFDTLEAMEPAGTGTKAVEEIFSDISRDKGQAARKVLGHLKREAGAEPIFDAGRRLVFRKGSDSHDYKFSSAVFEDHAHVAPAWRDRFVAASVYWLRGSGEADTPLVGRIRAAMKG